jgi:dihydrofolate reductase
MSLTGAAGLQRGYFEQEADMGKVVVSQFITLDGVVEDPGGSEGMDGGGWAFEFNRGEGGDKFKLDEVSASDALLLGRKTYEGFAAAWPGRTDDVGFADKFNSMPKYVASTTLSDPEWTNSHVLGDDLPAEVERIKQEHDRDILVNGSVQLVHALADAGLVDEWRLMVYPVVLGKGKKLFADGVPKTPLELTQSETVGDGVQILVYTPKA